MGNPMSLDTQVGPVTNQPQYEKILNYIDIAKSEGANAVLGGAPRDAARMRRRLVRRADHLHRREQRDAHRAGRSVRPGAVGDPVQGRGRSDRDRQRRRLRPGRRRLDAEHRAARCTMAERLQAGTVWVNTYRAVSYLSPFGGYKRIGHRPRERPGDDHLPSSRSLPLIDTWYVSAEALAAVVARPRRRRAPRKVTLLKYAVWPCLRVENRNAHPSAIAVPKSPFAAFIDNELCDAGSPGQAESANGCNRRATYPAIALCNS